MDTSSAGAGCPNQVSKKTVDRERSPNPARYHSVQRARPSEENRLLWRAAQQHRIACNVLSLGYWIRH